MLGTTNYRIENGTGLLETLMISMKTMQDTAKIQEELIERLTARVEALETAQIDGDVIA